MSETPESEGVRLQKVLAKAGVASRRAAEKMILQGRVSVDGEVVRELGRRVDPDSAAIHVDGARVVIREDLVYLALNKPKGVHTTMSDDQGRPCVGDIVRKWAGSGGEWEAGGASQPLFHVGRLDAETEGLLLLTNDGELSHRLTHPSYGVLKTYLAEVDGVVPRGLGKRLRSGVELEDGPVRVDGFRVVDALPGRTLVEVVIHEGRKRIVRRLLDEVGHPVQRLVRTAVGEVRLGNAKPGSLRPLTRQEIGSLHSAVGL